MNNKFRTNQVENQSIFKARFFFVGGDEDTQKNQMKFGIPSRSPSPGDLKVTSVWQSVLGSSFEAETTILVMKQLKIY